MSRGRDFRSRQRLDPDDRWEKILSAATESFHTKGFGQSSMRELARDVGLSVAGLYHYVEAKDDLLFAIIDSAVSQLLAELKEARKSTSAPEERIRALLAATVHVVVENRAEIRIQIDNTDKLAPARRAIIRDKQRECMMMVRNELERLRASGRLQNLDINVLTFALNGMANWIYYWYHPDGPVDVETLVEQLGTVFFHGILKDR